jgi:hypothetical protein
MKLQKGEDAFAADPPNHGIHFDPGVGVVPVTIYFEVLIAFANFQGSRDIGSVLFSSGFEFDHPGQING